MSFKFGPQTKTDVKVGYIDPTRGYVSGVSICDANTYAKSNPGTTFIFVDGDANIKYLNINEVNELTENDTVSSTDECGGLQTYEECTSPEIVFSGGGGIGAYGNPVIGVDGALLAVDLVSGGFGYQYPPVTKAVDKCQIGNGSVLQSVLGTVADTVEGGAPFETYEECPGDTVEYGRVYDQDGQDVGEWDPAKYLPIPGEDPILTDILEFQQSLKNPWWTTRDNKPLSITSQSETFSSNDATSPRWNDFLNKYAISPVAPSDVPGTDNAGKIFIFEWQENFPTTGNYVFRTLCDNKGKLYIDNLYVSDLNSIARNFNIGVITKEIQEGIHTIRVDLLNAPIYEVQTTTPGSAFFIKKDGEIYLDLTSFPQSTVNVTFSTYAISQGDAGRDHTIEFAELIFKDIKDVSNDSGTYGVPGGVLHGPIVQTGGDRLAIVEGRATEVDRGIEIVAYTGDNIAGGKDDFFVAIVGAELAEQPQPEEVSSQLNSFETQNVFNTVDYIDRADRTLWRTASNVSSISTLLNSYGVAPFDATTQQAKTDSYPGTHKIVWSGVTFPVNGDYVIELASDDDATLTIGGVVIEHKGFRSPGVPNADLTGTYYFTAGTYDIVAELYQIPGGNTRGLGDGNPMSIAVNINVSFAQEKVQSSLSWNQNPIGFAMVIQQPPRAIPQEIPPVSGPCPPNPIWSTRFPGYQNQWFPVNYSEREAWSDFMNRYALSPVPPLETFGSDASGIQFSNSWNVELPFRGFYGVQATADNAGRVLIDGIEVAKAQSYATETPEVTQVFLEAGTHKIDVQVSNYAQISSSLVKQKIFSTKDWRNVDGGIAQSVEVFFNVSNDSQTSLSFTFIAEDGSDTFTLLSPSEGFSSYTEVRTIKVGKKYKVVSGGNATNEQGLLSGSSETQDPSNKIFADYIDGANDNNDFVVEVTEGVFTSSNKRSISDSRDTFDITFEIPVSDAPRLDPVTETRNGVTYVGPPLFPFSLTTGGVDGTGWGDFMNEYSISPNVFDEINQPDSNINGVFVLVWKGVSFPETGTYQIKLAADNEAVLKSNGVEIARSSDFLSDDPTAINVNFTAGTYDLAIELQNFADGIDIFETNPMGVSLTIERDITVLSENVAADWVDNPMAISAILIPPPCIIKTGGTGVVVDVVVEDPGNGYIAPSPTAGGYPVLLQLSEVVVENPGINYNCGVDQIQIVPDLGANPTYTCDSFGRIQSVQVTPTTGYTSYPSITMPSTTGVNASFRPVFRVIRDPLPQPEEIIQVTDLVGLKQTGYVDGRAYYGAVYYENGVRFAGYYKTIGTPIRVYDTLQESITGEVTTVPSAIQRSGTDITSNDPTLNIPGTPQNLV